MIKTNQYFVLLKTQHNSKPEIKIDFLFFPKFLFQIRLLPLEDDDFFGLRLCLGGK